MDSILDSIKKQLGIESDYEYYDQDIMLCINSAFAVLNQLGVGTKECFEIEDNTTLWDCFSEDKGLLALVKQFVCAKVRLQFDPPLNGTIIELLNQTVKEMEFRISLYHKDEELLNEVKEDDETIE